LEWIIICCSGMDYNFAALCYSRMVDYAIVEWIQILLDYAIV
jgi:hypothetical protein